MTTYIIDQYIKDNNVNKTINCFFIGDRSSKIERDKDKFSKKFKISRYTAEENFLQTIILKDGRFYLDNAGNKGVYVFNMTDIFFPYRKVSKDEPSVNKIVIAIQPNKTTDTDTTADLQFHLSLNFEKVHSTSNGAYNDHVLAWDTTGRNFHVAPITSKLVTGGRRTRRRSKIYNRKTRK